MSARGTQRKDMTTDTGESIELPPTPPPGLFPPAADAINFDALPDMVRNAYAQAIENGWNYQVKIETPDGTKPALIIAVVQPESMDDWVGLLDEDQRVVTDTVRD